jgi:hypothetical protein
VIGARPHAKKRRCAQCLNVVPLFPATACKKPKRTTKSSNVKGGGQ